MPNTGTSSVAALCVFTGAATAYNTAAQASSRRAFLPRTAGAAAATALAWEGGHATGCNCSNCNGVHEPGCTCLNCSGFAFGPEPAAADEGRAIKGNGTTESIEAAYLIQEKETNARLKASGYKLDTREEEAARLSAAMSSFSYDSNSSTGKPNFGKANLGKGYAK